MSAPKLLDKKTINKEVAAQQKQQIESGVKMAKKVDAVRETLQEEEQNLEKFRVESVKRVQQEIDGKIRERDSLVIEIGHLKEERALEMIPLTEEWNTVNTEKALILQREIVISEREQGCTVREELLIEAEQKNKENTQRIISLRERVEEKLYVAEEERIEARKILKTAKEQSHHIVHKAQEKEREVNEKELTLIDWERDIRGREATVRANTLDIAKREQVLKDRYATLERDIKRIKK